MNLKKIFIIIYLNNDYVGKSKPLIGSRLSGVLRVTLLKQH